jgi:hypothetical protein
VQLRVGARVYGALTEDCRTDWQPHYGGDCHQLGGIELEVSDPVAARPPTERSLTIAREIGDRGLVARGCHQLGWIEPDSVTTTQRSASRNAR